MVSMFSLEEIKKLSGKQDMPDKKAERVREILYGLAEMALEALRQKKANETITRNSSMSKNP